MSHSEHRDPPDDLASHTDPIPAPDSLAESKPTPARIRVRLGEMPIPTLTGEEPCPKCKRMIRMPSLERTPRGDILIGLVPSRMTRRGEEIEGACTCGQRVVLYTPRLLDKKGRVR